MSSDPHLDFEVRRYKAIRDLLLADHGDDIDEETLADTTEGLTNLHELLAAIVRGALDDEAMILVLDGLIVGMKERSARFEHRAERRRQIVRDAMLEAGVDKLTMPDFTASVRPGQPHVVIVDEAIIPKDYIIEKPTVNKRAILNALKEGEQVEGAALSNPGMTLTVRTK